MTLSERIARGPAAASPADVPDGACATMLATGECSTHGTLRPSPEAWTAAMARLRVANPPESPAVARMRAAATARGTLATRPADNTLGDRIPEDRTR